MKSIPQLLKYNIKNSNISVFSKQIFQNDINNIKIKDDSKIWINKGNSKQKTLQIDFGKYSWISCIQIKATMIQKIIITWQNLQNYIMTKTIQVLNKNNDTFIIPFELQQQVREISIKLLMTSSQSSQIINNQTSQQNSTIYPTIYHILISQQTNQNIIYERNRNMVESIIKFKQSTPQKLMYKTQFLNCFSKLQPISKFYFLREYLEYYQQPNHKEMFYQLLMNIQQYKINKIIIIGEDIIPLESIANPMYQNLQSLNFFGCRIRNIQALSFMICPKLKTLILQNNQITHIKTLKKLNFKLNNLKLKKNYIYQLNYLCHLQLTDQGLDLGLYKPHGSFNTFMKVKKIKKRVQSWQIQQSVDSYLWQLKDKKSEIIYPSRRFIKALQIKIYGKYESRFDFQNSQIQQNEDQNQLMLIDPFLFQ